MSFVDDDIIYTALINSGLDSLEINVILQDNPGWIGIFLNADISPEAKIEIGNLGRTTMFIVATCAPCGYANLIKLSQWKTSKKINLNINKPLLICSALAFIVNISALFIPGVNTNVLNLVTIDQYFIN